MLLAYLLVITLFFYYIFDVKTRKRVVIKKTKKPFVRGMFLWVYKQLVFLKRQRRLSLHYFTIPNLNH